jgi:hypothetical protein
VPRDKPSKSQLKTLTATLEEHAPPRADIELLADGSLLILLYRYEFEPHRGTMKPWRWVRFNRRGSLFREAVRNDGRWDEFTADANSLNGWAGMPRSNGAVQRWMRQEVRVAV